MLNEYLIWMVAVLSVDLLLAVAAISAFRYLQGVVSGVDTTAELSKKDNFAFGISFAGGALALAMIIAAAVYGEPADSLLTEAFNVTIYAVLGIVLLKVGTLVNDKVIFRQLSLKQHIDEQNMAAGIVQAVNFVALGFVIQSSIHWVETESWDGLVSVAMVFFSTQILLLVVTRLRAKIYERRHQGAQLQDALAAGNIALAIRYAGHILAVALGVKASAQVIRYLPEAPWLAALEWFVVSLGMALLITGLAWVARKVILKGINIVEEVDEQQNVGVASIEAVIFISMALILHPLLSMMAGLL